MDQILDVGEKMNLDLNSENLKLDAEQELERLKINLIFQGKYKELLILAMCSFACTIVKREIELLLNEE